MPTKSLPKVIEQYDYMSIVFANGRFTIGRNGYSCSGNIPAEIFNKLVKFFKDTEGTYKERIDKLLEGDTLSGIYPNWEIKDEIKLKVEDLVTMEYKKQIHKGVIKKMKKINASVQFETLGLVDVPFNMLKLQ